MRPAFLLGHDKIVERFIPETLYLTKVEGFGAFLTALLEEEALSGPDATILRQVLDHGGSPSDGVPLFLAAGYGKMLALDILIEAGDDVNFRSNFGGRKETTLYVAAQFKKEDVVSRLLKQGLVSI